MKTAFCILAFFSFSTCFSQENCTAIIDWKYLKTIDIYEKPSGKIVYQMKNDSANEDFLHLKIIHQKGNYFYVSIHLSIRKESTTGWIKKAAYVGTYRMNEKLPMDLILYKNKKMSEQDKIIIANWIPTLLTIENCADNWTFVSLRHNGLMFKGWIQSNVLCANAYSTCN